jgi:hypothetical protein
MPHRRITRDVNEDARDIARTLMATPEYEKSRDERKKVEMRFAHLKTHHRFDRMRLRGLTGARDEFHLAAYRAEPQDPRQPYLATAVENARCMRCLASVASSQSQLVGGLGKEPSTGPQVLKSRAIPPPAADFFNAIGQNRKSPGLFDHLVGAAQQPQLKLSLRRAMAR